MNKKIETASFVTPSASMVPPPVDNMLARRNYVVRPDAPATHARLSGNPDSGIYHLTFNGFDLVTLEFNPEIAPGLRYHSDGDFQSTPFIQQFLMWSKTATRVRVSLRAPVEMWNMRPQRAARGQAILGQSGYPLLYGVNGMYLPDWDILLSWYGYDFEWEDARIKCEDGVYSASMTLELTAKPFVLLFRPRYYGEHLGYGQFKPWEFRPNAKAITGWCSWEAYHSNITEEDLKRDALTLKPLKNYGMEYMQVDDGYQQELVPTAPGRDVPDSWIHINAKFPGGHAGIVDAIHAGGFEAGIWTNATLTNRAAAEALGCCLKREDGSLIRGDWIQYIIDCMPETLEKQVTPYYRAFRDAGYKYCKSDSLRHLIYDGMQEAVRLGLMEPEDARKRQVAYMRAARKGLGDDVYYLSCWGVLSQSIGICDAMRVATDANPKWGAYSMQLRETARWYFAHRVLFTLDPDHVCVRGELKWVRMMLSLVSLTGGLMMISDRPEAYDEARITYLHKTMPALTVRTAETGPIDYTTPACAPMAAPVEQGCMDIGHETDSTAPFASLWCTHFDEYGRRWSVVHRTAVIPLDALDFPLENAALDPTRTYYAWNFWDEKGEIVSGGRLHLSALSLGADEVIGLTPIDEGVPALVGSDRHVSMDAVSVTECEQKGGVFTLTLKGFEGLSARYFVYAPSLKGEIAHVTGAQAACEKRGDIAVITVNYSAADAIVGIR